jgi:hypothetical protein
MLFFDDGAIHPSWPQRLYSMFTNPDTSKRFDAPIVADYNLAFLCASGPFGLDVGQTQRFSMALAYAGDLDALRTRIGAARDLHGDGYRLVRLGVDTAAPPPHAVLLGNHPNPFARETRVRFILHDAERVRLDVFDVDGRHVATRDPGVLGPGEHGIALDAPGMAPGVYLYRLASWNGRSGAEQAALTGRMLVIR